MYTEINQQIAVRIAQVKLTRRFLAFNSIITSSGGVPPVDDWYWDSIASGVAPISRAYLAGVMLNYQVALQTL